MTWLEIGLLALALAADAFGVGAALGLTHRSKRERFRVAFHFGLFQALMPLLSGMAGAGLREAAGSWLGWVGGGLLLFLGGKMLLSSQAGPSEDTGKERSSDHRGGRESKRSDPTRGWTLVGLSLSVSIDALGAGFVLGVRKAPLLGAAMVIGLTTTLLTLVGMLVGSALGRRVGPVAGKLGGLVLVGLGFLAFFGG